MQNIQLVEKEHYINELYSKCQHDTDSFIAWMTDVHHYSVDGWIVRNLQKYIDTNEKLSIFFNRFANEYKYDLESLTQCCIDVVDFYKKLACN